MNIFFSDFFSLASNKADRVEELNDCGNQKRLKEIMIAEQGKAKINIDRCMSVVEFFRLRFGMGYVVPKCKVY